MKVKSDKEFVAECEVVVRNGGKFSTYEGVPVLLSGGTIEMLSEAVERLKRWQGVVFQVPQCDTCGTILSAYCKCREKSDADKYGREIAELKRLLRWCHNQAKKIENNNEASCSDAHDSFSWPVWDDFEKSPEKARIEEILKQSES